jgi:hypothetical protein
MNWENRRRVTEMRSFFETIQQMHAVVATVLVRRMEDTLAGRRRKVAWL